MLKYVQAKSGDVGKRSALSPDGGEGDIRMRTVVSVCVALVLFWTCGAAMARPETGPGPQVPSLRERSAAADMRGLAERSRQERRDPPARPGSVREERPSREPERSGPPPRPEQASQPAPAPSRPAPSREPERSGPPPRPEQASQPAPAPSRPAPSRESLSGAARLLVPSRLLSPRPRLHVPRRPGSPSGAARLLVPNRLPSLHPRLHVPRPPGSLSGAARLRAPSRFLSPPSSP